MIPPPGELRRFLIKCTHFIGPTRAFALICPHVVLRGRLFALAVWVLSARGVLAPVCRSRFSQCHAHRPAAVRHGHFPIFVTSLHSSSRGVPASVSKRLSFPVVFSLLAALARKKNSKSKSKILKQSLPPPAAPAAACACRQLAALAPALALSLRAA